MLCDKTNVRSCLDHFLGAVKKNDRSVCKRDIKGAEMEKPSYGLLRCAADRAARCRQFNAGSRARLTRISCKNTKCSARTRQASLLCIGGARPVREIGPEAGHFAHLVAPVGPSLRPGKPHEARRFAPGFDSHAGAGFGMGGRSRECGGGGQADSGHDASMRHSVMIPVLVAVLANPRTAPCLHSASGVRRAAARAARTA